MTSLIDLGLSGSPLVDPLSYPGERPPTGGLLVDDRFLPVDPVAGLSIGDHTVVVDVTDGVLDQDGPMSLALDAVLDRLAVARVDQRVPILAAGSNASPGQMREKLRRAGASPVLPMLAAEVDGWLPVVAALVSRPGYIPISAIRSDAAHGLPMTVLFCDDAQLAAIDATEPNYERMPGGPDTPVEIAGGRVLDDFGVYRIRFGVLGDADGTPLPWTSETEAIEAALAAAPSLGQRCGTTPDQFVVSCRANPWVRSWVRDELERSGRVVC